MTPITFIAEVVKVATLADGGIRLTLDLSEQDIPQAAMLMECKRQGIALSVEMRAYKDSLTELDDETEKDTEREVTRVDRRRFADR